MVTFALRAAAFFTNSVKEQHTNKDKICKNTRELEKPLLQVTLTTLANSFFLCHSDLEL